MHSRKESACLELRRQYANTYAAIFALSRGKRWSLQDDLFLRGRQYRMSPGLLGNFIFIIDREYSRLLLSRICASVAELSLGDTMTVEFLTGQQGECRFRTFYRLVDCVWVS
jgi:hypothetical protein